MPFWYHHEMARRIRIFIHDDHRMGALMKNKVPLHVASAFFDAEYAGVRFFAQYVLNAPGRPERFHGNLFI
jgi:hypothetical protein